MKSSFVNSGLIARARGCRKGYRKEGVGKKPRPRHEQIAIPVSLAGCFEVTAKVVDAQTALWAMSQRTRLKGPGWKKKKNGKTIKTKNFYHVRRAYHYAPPIHQKRPRGGFCFVLAGLSAPTSHDDLTGSISGPTLVPNTYGECYSNGL